MSEERSQWQALNTHVPELFRLQPGRAALYVGASVERCYHANELDAAGYSLTLVEAYAPNAQHHKARGLFETVVQGTVQDLPDLPHFDLVMWWHGPEHVERASLPRILAHLEELAPLVVLGCPYGEYRQGAVGGNEYEIHRWSIYPDDLERLGYTVYDYQANVHEILAVKQCTR